MTAYPPQIVLSLGAGVQSSTLALMATRGEIPMPDYAIFADTKAEPDVVYRWLDWLETQLSFPVYRVSKGDLSKASLVVRTSRTGTQYQKHSPPAWIKSPDGRVGIAMRQCTADFKISPIRAKLREMGGKKYGVVQYIGISLDEAHRMKPSKDSWIENRWPLIDLRMSRHDCLNWMKKHDYPIPPRSSCYFCPYHSDSEWQKLKTYDFLAFEAAIEWEKSFTDMMTQIPGFFGTPYLHRSCVPLSQIDFNLDSRQADLFGNECEGMCGV